MVLDGVAFADARLTRGVRHAQRKRVGQLGAQALQEGALAGAGGAAQDERPGATFGRCCR